MNYYLPPPDAADLQRNAQTYATMHGWPMTAWIRRAVAAESAQDKFAAQVQAMEQSRNVLAVRVAELEQTIEQLSTRLADCSEALGRAAERKAVQP